MRAVSRVLKENRRQVEVVTAWLSVHCVAGSHVTDPDGANDEDSIGGNPAGRSPGGQCITMRRWCLLVRSSAVMPVSHISKFTSRQANVSAYLEPTSAPGSGCP
jgi:hypothetical protein